MLGKISPSNNAVNWFEIPVLDMDRAMAFYQSVFELKLERITNEEGEMALFPRTEQGPMGLSGVLSGSLLKNEAAKPSMTGVLIYLNASPSLQPALDRLEKSGGKIILPYTSIPAGKIAVCVDSEGNRIGLHAAE